MSAERRRRLRHSRRQEQATAARHGGKVTPASGALPGAGSGGDVRLQDWLVENKRTEGRSFSVKRSDLEKISRDSAHRGVDPVMEIEFGDGVHAGGERWYLVPEWVADDRLFGADG